MNRLTMVARRTMAVSALAAAVALAGWSSVRATRADVGATDIGTADALSRAVAAGDIAKLQAIAIPADASDAAELKQWRDQYVKEMTFNDKQRTEEYEKETTEAQKAEKAGDIEKALAETVAANEIAKDKTAFIAAPWVQEITSKSAAQAADYEKQGRWIESLQLYTDLNTLYEIDTRYKADMQRLARRTRLLAMYVPQELMAQRKEIIARELKHAAAAGTATKPSVAATQPADSADETSAFTRWQDEVQDITPDMVHEAISNTRNGWVEQVSYETLMKGGIEALRLFLSTPELAKAFPALGDKVACAKFEGALDAALAKIQPNQPLTIDDVDQSFADIVKTSDASVKLPMEVLAYEFTDGAMEQLDPFSAVIWPHEADEFNKNTRGSFGGVGVQISMEDGQLKIVSPLEDTPAYNAGIEAGDVIAAIDGKSTVGISIDQAVHSIMGPENTQVTLRIRRVGTPLFDKTLTRAKIQVKSVKGWWHDPADETKWDYMIDPKSKIGYIRITGFQELTADEMAAAIDQLVDQNVRGIVIDLRFNPGGLLQTAVRMCDMLLDHGTIVSTRGRVAKPMVQMANENEKKIIPVNMPLIVLVNQYSASASEIFSGAMKDLNRAEIVGVRSFGKGSVQNLMDLQGKALMKLTVAHYYLPNGESLHRNDRSTTWGVEPDVHVYLTPDEVLALLEAKRDSEIIHGKAGDAAPAATTQSTTRKGNEPVYDTQLDTALLMMRLQLLQQKS